MERRSFLAGLAMMLSSPFSIGAFMRSATTSNLKAPEPPPGDPVPDVEPPADNPLDFRASRVSLVVAAGGHGSIRLAPDRPIVLEGMRLEGENGLLVSTVVVAGLPIQNGSQGAPIAMFDAVSVDTDTPDAQFVGLPRGVSAFGQGRNVLRGQSIEIFVENKTDRDQTVVWWLFHSTLGATRFYVDPQPGDIPDPTVDEFVLHCEIGRHILDVRKPGEDWEAGLRALYESVRADLEARKALEARASFETPSV